MHPLRRATQACLETRCAQLSQAHQVRLAALMQGCTCSTMRALPSQLGPRHPPYVWLVQVTLWVTQARCHLTLHWHPPRVHCTLWRPRLHVHSSARRAARRWAKVGREACCAGCRLPCQTKFVTFPDLTPTLAAAVGSNSSRSARTANLEEIVHCWMPCWRCSLCLQSHLSRVSSGAAASRRCGQLCAARFSQIEDSM